MAARDRSIGKGAWIATAWRCVAVAVLLCLGACSDGKSADSAKVLYGCASQADCLPGYTCTSCKICQKAGETMACPDAASPGPDASDPDTGDTTAADIGKDQGDVQPDGPADVPTDVPVDVPIDVPSDVPPNTCNLVNWLPCPAGSGCYYTSSTKTKACQAHGTLGLNAVCDPAQFQCGVATLNGMARPLRCDVQDSKCYPTCNCQAPATWPCALGDTCFCLVGADGQNLPDGAGICAK